jgi:hypothetical protein
VRNTHPGSDKESHLLNQLSKWTRHASDQRALTHLTEGERALSHPTTLDTCGCWHLVRANSGRRNSGHSFSNRLQMPLR